MDALSVTQAIEAAFPLQPLPEMSVHQAQLSDDSMSREITDKEWAAAGQPDSDRTWREFTDEELMSCDAALSHFDEPSFVYYLPAFLLFSIRYCDVEWSHPARELVGGTVFSVTHRSPHSLSRYKCLSPAQRGTVVSFLEFIVAQEAAMQTPRRRRWIAIGKPLRRLDHWLGPNNSFKPKPLRGSA